MYIYMFMYVCIYGERAYLARSFPSKWSRTGCSSALTAVAKPVLRSASESEPHKKASRT